MVSSSEGGSKIYGFAFKFDHPPTEVLKMTNPLWLLGPKNVQANFMHPCIVMTRLFGPRIVQKNIMYNDN